MRTRALSLHQQGWSWTKIATELGCHRTTVMRLVHKWQQTGCIGDLPHRRRPRPNPASNHAPDHQQNHLTHHNSNRLSAPPLSLKPSRWDGQEVENRHQESPTASNNTISSASAHHSSSRSTTVTVRRRLKELRSQLGIQTPPSPPPNTSCSKPPLQPPKQTPQQPPQQPSKPPRSLSEVESFSAEELSRVVFSDMKIFLADKVGGIRVWRLGQPPLDSYSGLQGFFGQGGVSATFWACLSGSGRRGLLLHIPNELTEERYVQILHNGLLPSAAAIYGLNAHRFLFAQDKASIQASPAVEDFLRQQQVQCVEWPARSSDLNPCDLLWPEVESLAASSAGDTPPATVAQLVTAVRNAYEAVDPAYIQWLVAPARIRSLCRRIMAAKSNSSQEHTANEDH
ncbi:hypothetical protein JTE90_019458 [Oedothorax gibbosus]|uniref:Transposase n=1 Tax=Oedothorax gibbosus TaxID=931172 RepID=A0AAV6UXF1_9ARAC|nr:hypothetical protein JTE90_019458 [Oedothorax gibbosus]